MALFRLEMIGEIITVRCQVTHTVKMNASNCVFSSSPGGIFIIDECCHCWSELCVTVYHVVDNVRVWGVIFLQQILSECHFVRLSVTNLLQTFSQVIKFSQRSSWSFYFYMISLISFIEFLIKGWIEFVCEFAEITIKLLTQEWCQTRLTSAVTTDIVHYQLTELMWSTTKMSSIFVCNCSLHTKEERM